MVDIQLWHWVVFGAFVTLLLVLDLGVFHRHARETTFREALVWTCVWCSLALGFNVFVFFWLGRKAAIEFLTGYALEWSLSIDNVFLFAVVFGYFGVPRRYQYRVLFWGILGAVFMRLAFILIGTELVQRFAWVGLLLGLLLLYLGIRIAFQDSEPDPEHNLLFRIAKRYLRVSHGETGEKFFVRQNGLLHVTPLFLVLLVVESFDVMFAVDSVPAIIGVVSANEPYFRFIVFTSNVFAILGLRALYFLLAGVMDLFRYLNYGLGAILAFVGLKMLAERLIGHPYEWPASLWNGPPPADYVAEHHKLISAEGSLAVIATLLTISIAASVLANMRDARRPLPPDATEPPAEDDTAEDGPTG